MNLVLALHFVTQAVGGSLGGTVTEAGTGTRLEDVSVHVIGTNTHTSTQADGSYHLDSLASGWHRVRFSRIGYGTMELRAFIDEDSAARVDVALGIEPLPLPPVDVVRPLGRLDGSDYRPREHDVAHVGTKTLTMSGGHPLIDTPDLFGRLSAEADVATRPEAAGGLHVRGGSADQNLLLLDGAPILGGQHAFGMAGILNPDLLRAVELHAGVPPPQYGGRLSSVLSVESRQPTLDRPSVRTGVDGFTSHLTIDAPLVPGRVGTLVSARRGMGGLLGSFADQGPKFPAYWDAFAAVSTPLGGGDLRIFVFRSSDQVDFSNPESAQQSVDEGSEGVNRFGWTAGTSAVRWRRASDDTRLDAVAWRATTGSTGAWMVEQSELDAHSDLSDVGLRGTVRVARERGWLMAGGGLHREGLTFQSTAEGVVGLATQAQRREAEAFGEWHEAVHDRFGWTLGLRSTFDAQIRVEPRVTLSFAPTLGSVISGGYARSSQSVQSLANEESVLDAAIAAEFPGALSSGGGATADQVTVAAQVELTSSATLSIESYARWMSDIVLVGPATDAPAAVSGYELGQARASGLQATAAHLGQRWQTTLTYRLSRARRTRPDGTTYRPSFDRTHWGTVGASYGITEIVTVRGGLRAGSESVTTLVQPGFQWGSNEPLLGKDEVLGIPSRFGHALNGMALPPFVSLDLGVRATWEHRVGGRPAVISAFMSVSNLLGRANALTYRRDPSGSLELIPLRPLALNAGARVLY